MDDLAALRWLVEAGADEAIGETPLDRFAALPPPPPIAAPAAKTPARAVVPVPAAPVAAPTLAAPQPAAQAELAARTAAAAAQSLAELRAAVAAFEGCALKATATNLVFADGNPAAPLMLMGDAPRADDDRTGTPFSGDIGKLLDRMLAAIGLDRSSVYIANAIPWRPSGDRQPTPAEIAACLPFARRHIALARPKLLVLFGELAARSLLGTSEGIIKLRGRWKSYEDPALPAPINVLATYHPWYLLKQPLQKRDSWSDLLSIKQKIGEL
ncbi:MAG: uracil-DNA glycosylase [Magnetospirillum sp.]|jgi:uracil-DNA glycosylase|nr:uracil-DNA glycosylase [Magnetospirillum sp.]